MKFLTGFFLFIFLSVNVPLAEAYEAEDEFRLQLLAIAEYLEQMLPANTSLGASETRDIIFNGAEWIVSAQEGSGHFGYEYEPYEDNYLNDDGMVRQAGTLFALSEVYKHQTEKDPAIAKTIERAIEYFVSVSGESEPEDGDFWCIKNSERSSRCDLGSVSLALIGILNYVATEPEKESKYEEIIDKYISYLKAAKFPGEGFSAKYYLGDGFSDSESPFYNGEAMLALVKYYQFEKDEEVRTMLDEVFVHLSAKEEYETPLYLWIMAALKDMQRLWPNEAYVQYATEFTTWRLDRSEGFHSIDRNYCAPVEGYTSAYTLLEEGGAAEHLERLGREIDFWLNKTSYLQLDKNNPYRLVSIDGQLQLKKLPNPAVAHGGFLTGEEVLTQRIDFTQHCVSSYLQKLTDIDGQEL